MCYLLITTKYTFYTLNILRVIMHCTYCNEKITKKKKLKEKPPIIPKNSEKKEKEITFASNLQLEKLLLQILIGPTMLCQYVISRPKKIQQVIRHFKKRPPNNMTPKGSTLKGEYHSDQRQTMPNIKPNSLSSQEGGRVTFACLPYTRN